MRKRLLAIVMAFCALPLAAQIISPCSSPGSPSCLNVQTIATSGQTITITNTGGLVPTFEYVWSGSPSAITVTLSGCGQSGTCETLDTYSSSTSSLRAPSIAKVYYSYTITATWTGTASLKVSTVITSARLPPGGAGGGASFPAGGTGVVCNISQTASTNCTPAQIFAAISPSEHSNGTCTTAATISAVNGNHQNVTLTNADTCALTFTQPSSGTITITLKIIQSSSGSFNGTISGGKWPGGSVPTITATSAAVDFISCYLDGATAYCVGSQNFQ